MPNGHKLAVMNGQSLAGGTLKGWVPHPFAPSPARGAIRSGSDARHGLPTSVLRISASDQDADPERAERVEGRAPGSSARVRRFAPLPPSPHAALNGADTYQSMYTAPMESSQEELPAIGWATRQLQNAVAAAHAAFYRTFRPFRASDFDLLQLLLRMNEPRESVTHKICYTDGSGKKHCI